MPGEAHALARHAVKVGRLERFLPVTTQIAIAEIIRKNVYNVRLRRSWQRAGENQPADQAK